MTVECARFGAEREEKWDEWAFDYKRLAVSKVQYDPRNLVWKGYRVVFPRQGRAGQVLRRSEFCNLVKHVKVNSTF